MRYPLVGARYPLVGARFISPRTIYKPAASLHGNVRGLINRAPTIWFMTIMVDDSFNLLRGAEGPAQFLLALV